MAQHLLTILSAYLLYAIVHSLLACPKASWGSAVFFNASGMTLAYAHTILSDFWVMFFLLSCIYLLQRARASMGRPRLMALVVGGVCFVAMVLSKLSPVGLIVFVPVYFLTQYGFRRETVVLIAVFVVPYVATFVPATLENLKNTGVLWGETLLQS